MSVRQSRTNPFASPSQSTKTASTNAKAKVQAKDAVKDKKDTARASAKQHLLDALDAKSDSSLPDLKFTSEQLSIDIEKNIYDQLGDDSKYKGKIYKIKTRLSNNKTIREGLKRGDIEVNAFCTLDEATFNDNAYFQAKTMKKTDGEVGNIQKGGMTKPNMGMGMGAGVGKYHKPPVINRPIIPVDTKVFEDDVKPIEGEKEKGEQGQLEKKENEDNENKNKDEDKIKPMDKPMIGLENNKVVIDQFIFGDDNQNDPKPIEPLAIVTKDTPPATIITTENLILIESGSGSLPSSSVIANENLDLPNLLLLKKTLEEKKKKNKKKGVDEPKKKKGKGEKGKNKVQSQPMQQPQQHEQQVKEDIINKVNPFIEEEPIEPIEILTEEKVLNPVLVQPQPNVDQEVVQKDNKDIKDSNNHKDDLSPVKENDNDININQPNINEVIHKEAEEVLEKKEGVKKQIPIEEPHPQIKEDTKANININYNAQSNDSKPKRTKTNDFELLHNNNNNSNTNSNINTKSPFESHRQILSFTQRDISPFTDTTNKPLQSFSNSNNNINNDNGLSFSQLDSSIIKEKYKQLNEIKLALETKVEIMKHEALSYQNEISSLKAALSQSKPQQSSQSSEEMIKLDLIKTKQLLKANEAEKESLVKENIKLKSQLKTYEDNYESMIEDNKTFRFETEKRFAMYQKEIDQLRIQLTNANADADANDGKNKRQSGYSNKMAMSQQFAPSSMNNDNIVNVLGQGQGHNEPIDNDNGIPEQNLLYVNDNTNMNGNIYDETKNEIMRDVTGNNQGMIYNNEEEEEERKSKNNEGEVNINDVDDINAKKDDVFDIINAHDFDKKSPIREKENEKEEVRSPMKDIKPLTQPQAQAQSQTLSGSIDQKAQFQKTINDLFDNSDDDGNDEGDKGHAEIFKYNPSPNKKINIKPQIEQSVTTTTTTNTINTNVKPRSLQPKTITPPIVKQPQPQSQPQQPPQPQQQQQLPPKKQETKPKVTSQQPTENNLFNDLENELDDEIFNKQDGEGIFGKSVGNSLFD